MALIDSNNFITHLVWSGLIDRATCGQLKEAIEQCTVDAIPVVHARWIKHENAKLGICMKISWVSPATAASFLPQ